jgi:hypothetical protein
MIVTKDNLFPDGDTTEFFNELVYVEQSSLSSDVYQAR